jgi:hypothetical protein
LERQSEQETIMSLFNEDADMIDDEGYYCDE